MSAAPISLYQEVHFMPLPKPEPVARVAYDYNACRRYLEEKYGYNERDVARKFDRADPTNDGQRPYQDFWHWVVENYAVHRGCYLTFSRVQYDEDPVRLAPDWVRVIYDRYLAEFADASGTLELFVDW